MNGNSAKFYDKAYSQIGSVLRGAETTINTVRDFRAFRPKEGGPEEDLQWRPLRKGIADLHRRAEVSQKANERLLNALANVDDSRSVEELTAGIQKPVHWGGRKVRGLRPWADDKGLCSAINHGDFLINGFRNRDLTNCCTPPQPNRRWIAGGVPQPSAASCACSGRTDSSRRCLALTGIMSPKRDAPSWWLF